VPRAVGFFRSDADPDDEQDDWVESGGIPRRAEERLKALRDGSLFTSGLSVNEFALLGRLGPQPLAQIMGASVIRPGWQYLPALDPGMVVTGSWTGTISAGRGLGPSSSGRALQNRFGEAAPAQVRNYLWHAEVVCELDTLTDAWNLARRRALDRLTEEALQVDADAVVGVHLQRSDHDLGKGTIEYVVSGTAIRLPDSDGATWPILTDLSVQDYWRLHAAGHEPAGFAAATSAVFASPPRSTRLRRLRTTRRGQELDELSRGFRAARETVRARLLGQVRDAHGTGAVGVEFAHSIHRDKLALASAIQSATRRGWHVGLLGLPYKVSGRLDVERSGWVITMHAAGTAIRPRRRPARPEVKTAIRLRGR
jgi:uncharacterized protein YbjQ (UPF0145 family)